MEGKTPHKTETALAKSSPALSPGVESGLLTETVCCRVAGPNRFSPFVPGRKPFMKSAMNGPTLGIKITNSHHADMPMSCHRFAWTAPRSHLITPTPIRDSTRSGCVALLVVPLCKPLGPPQSNPHRTGLRQCRLGVQGFC